MAESFKDKLEEAGHKVAEAATKAGHTVGEKVEEAKDWAKETAHKAGHTIDEMTQKAEHKAGDTFGETGPAGTTADIKEHMEVYASCGTKVGKVDHVLGSSIKLTKNDSADGLHHVIPMAWVKRVDQHVHLSKDHVAVQGEWKPA